MKREEIPSVVAEALATYICAGNSPEDFPEPGPLIDALLLLVDHGELDRLLSEHKTMDGQAAMPLSVKDYAERRAEELGP